MITARIRNDFSLEDLSHGEVTQDELFSTQIKPKRKILSKEEQCERVSFLAGHSRY